MKFKRSKNFKLKSRNNVSIDSSVIFGSNVTVYENNRIEGKTVIGDNVVILPGSYIKDSLIENDVVIDSSRIESAVIKSDCQVGPFARLRPGSVLYNGVKIGNFCEIKNSEIGENTKINHLAYVGDATVGKNCNIGCGAIFVNYNGKIKQRTVVGDNCFIGSNCNVIAPVNIKSNAYVCAGTTVTDDVSDDGFVIGRARQEEKKNRAHLYLKKKEK